MLLTPRLKALDYLLAHCRHGQRTKDLLLKRAYVDLEIELTAMRDADVLRAGSNVVPMAVNFSRRDEDPKAGGQS